MALLAGWLDVTDFSSFIKPEIGTSHRSPFTYQTGPLTFSSDWPMCVTLILEEKYFKFLCCSDLEHCRTQLLLNVTFKSLCHWK